MFQEGKGILFHSDWNNDIPQKRYSFYTVPCWGWGSRFISGPDRTSACINFTGRDCSFCRKIIMKKAIIQLLEAHPGYQFSQRELLKRLKIQTAKRKQFRQILNSLVEKEKRVQLRGNTYSISQKKRSVQGRLSITQKGFGFLCSNVPRNPG